MLNNVRIYFKLVSAKKDVYFNHVWQEIPSYHYTFGVYLKVGDKVWFPDGNTIDYALHNSEGADYKWGAMQDYLREKFQRDKDSLYLTYQPIVYYLDERDNLIRKDEYEEDIISFDWNEKTDYTLAERLKALFFDSELLGEALGSNYDLLTNKMIEDTTNNFAFDIP